MPTYRYKTSDGATLTEQEQKEYGNIMQQAGSDELTLAGGRKVQRYTEGVTTPSATTTETKTDPVADYYTNLRDTYKAPDEARRQALRGEAEREVSGQLAAIDQAYMTMIADERARQSRLAEQGARQISGIGRLSGLAGSSVQAQRQSEQATKAAEAERAATQALQAKQAYERAQIIGQGQAAAEARFKEEQRLAQEAQKAYGEYLTTTVAKSVAPVEVGGYLVDPKTGKVIFAAPAKAGEAKTYTLKPGESVFDANGKLIASLPASAADGKPITLAPGEIAYDATGKEIARGGEKVESSPASVQEYQYALSNGYKGSYADFIAMKASIAPTVTAQIKAETEQAQEAAKQKQAAEAAAAQAQQVQSVIGSARSLIDETDALGSIGRVAASKVPGTKSYALAQTISTLKANLGFGTLQQLKQQSGNGASGLGALSDNEMKLLTDQVASLDIGQDSKTLRANLDVVFNKYQKFIDALKTPPQTAMAPSGAAPKDDLDAALDAAGFKKVGSGTANAQIPQTSRLAYVNANPGNLKYAGQPGAVMGEGGFAKFPSVEAGINALYNDVRAKQTGRTVTGLGPQSTLAQFIGVYAPPSENNTALYVQQAAQALGISPNTPIGQIDTNALVRFIAKKESSTVIG